MPHINRQTNLPDSKEYYGRLLREMTKPVYTEKKPSPIEMLRGYIRKLETQNEMLRRAVGQSDE